MEKGWFRGISQTAFAPEQAMNPTMLATVLSRMGGQDSSPALALTWALEQGFLDEAQTILTREALIDSLYRFAMRGQSTNQAGVLETFADQDAMSPWATQAMEWAVATGIVLGDGSGKLQPQAVATRGACAVMLMRFAQGWEEEE